MDPVKRCEGDRLYPRIGLPPDLKTLEFSECRRLVVLDALDTSARKIGISTEKNSAIELRRDHTILYIDTLLDTSSARARNRMNYYIVKRLQIIVAHAD